MNNKMFVVVVDDSDISNILKAVPAKIKNELLTQQLSMESEIDLTPREKDVLRLIIEGKSNSEIAKRLIISVHTAKAHVCSILQKLCVSDRVQAAVKAVREGLI